MTTVCILPMKEGKVDFAELKVAFDIFAQL